MDRRLRELIEEGYPVTPQAVQGMSAYMHGHIRRFGDYELEMEEVPPPISEEALTSLFEHTTERAAPADGGNPMLEAH